MRLLAAFTFAVGLSALTACNSNSDLGGNLVAIPAVGTPRTETFSGTVQVNGTDIHTFTIDVSGNVTITLTAAGPPPTITMGVTVGNPSTPAGGTTTTCAALTGGTINTPAGSTPQLSGALLAATYCIAVSDVGNQTAPVNYTVVVTHT